MRFFFGFFYIIIPISIIINKRNLLVYIFSFITARYKSFCLIFTYLPGYPVIQTEIRTFYISSGVDNGYSHSSTVIFCRNLIFYHLDIACDIVPEACSSCIFLRHYNFFVDFFLAYTFNLRQSGKFKCISFCYLKHGSRKFGIENLFDFRFNSKALYLVCKSCNCCGRVTVIL